MKKILEICCKGRTATTAPVEEAVPPVDVPGPAPAAADAPPAASETVEEAVADQHPAEEPAASGSQGEQAQEAAALEEAAVVETVPTTSAEAVADEPGGHPLAAASTAMRRFEGKVVIVTGWLYSPGLFNGLRVQALVLASAGKRRCYLPKKVLRSLFMDSLQSESRYCLKQELLLPTRVLRQPSSVFMNLA